MYTKAEFGKELEAQLVRDFDVIGLSRWAYNKYLEKCSELSDDAEDVIMKIVTMEEGIEFQYSKEELEKLAKDLQK